MKKLAVLSILFVASFLNAAPKVVILGFDGVDHGYLSEYMEAGHLPNLQKLAQEGSFSALRPTVPPQTPVSWSTFTTGLQPGQHMIFDFLKRDIETYMPSFAIAVETEKPFLFGPQNGIYLGLGGGLIGFILFFLGFTLFRFRMATRVIAGLSAGAIAGGLLAFVAVKYLPESQPWLINNQKGQPFWQVLGDRGYKCKVIRMPVTFPAKSFEHGYLFAGLGVPDLSGRIGKPFFFTSDLFIPGHGSNEFSVEIVELPDNRGTMDVTIVGPPNKFFDEPDYISIPMNLTVAENHKSLAIKVCGQELTLQPGEWSGWVDFVFPFNPIVKVRGIGRFYLDSLEPEVNLYLSPINFDPAHLPPGFTVTYPYSWAKTLADRFGLFKTIGWSVDTWTPSEELLGEEFFMDEWKYNAEMFEKWAMGFMEDDDDLLFQYYEFTDRVGHIFFRFLDEGHPAYDAKLAERYASVLYESYDMMDEIVGKVMEKMPPDTRLIVLSDHGFASFRYAVNYNTWLVQNGYMALTGADNITQSLESLFDRGQFWPNVDWSKTKAYCMGLSGLYVNLKGREAQGIVEPGEEYEALRRELVSRLESWVDEKTGMNPVAKVYTREEAYGRFDPVLIPDMIITNTPRYRVSWQTSLGGIPSELISDNNKVWSGDHCTIFPDALKGILFSNIKFRSEQDPFIGDLYPTILDLFDVEPPYETSGSSLLP